MAKLLGRATALYMLLSISVMAAPGLPSVRVSAKFVDWIRCGNIPGMKVALQLEFRNELQNTFVLGNVSIAQERLYRKGAKGVRELIETTSTPDEFDLKSPSEYFSTTKQQNLLAHTSKILTIVHYLYFSSTDLSPNGNSWELLSSFRVTNVRRDGSASEWWSDPVVIAVPRECTLRGNNAEFSTVHQSTR